LIEVVVQRGENNSLVIGSPTMAQTTVDLNLSPNMDGGLTISVVTKEQAEAVKAAEEDDEQ
jgi:stage III sporulation protein SpoIIIAA